MQSKKWYQSKTIWGVIIAALGFFLSHYLQVDIALPHDVAVDGVEQSVQCVKNSNGNMQIIMANVMTVIGLITALIGRFKAETQVTL